LEDAVVNETAALNAHERRSMDWEGFFRRFREPGFVPGFQIENKLGGGVFGEVYRARKLSIGKPYAIKFLKLADEGARDDLFRELQQVEHFAQVDHPHLVSIEDKGEVLGIPYIVMNFAGDETLKVRLSSAPLPAPDAGVLFRQILDGVAALHERSIIHFDLKPANIFLKGDVARVGDYGLSKLVTESARTLSMGRGTPAYMAPEMLHRKGDARSDVYSLGAIFYEMLSGDPPFRGDSEWEVLKKHETAPVVYSERVPAAYRPFLDRALAKDPDARFPDSGAMLRGFDVCVGGPSAAASAAAPRVPGGVAAPPTPPPSSAAAGAGAVIGRKVGEAVGRGAGATYEQVRTGVQEILQHLRDGTTDALVAGKAAYQKARVADARTAVPPPFPRRRGWFFRLVTAPFRLIGWIFRNLLSVLAVLAVLALCIGAAEFAARAVFG
jgi:hypothetical protein